MRSFEKETSNSAFVIDVLSNFLCQHPFPIHISECSSQHYTEQATFWQLIYISRTMLSSHRFEERHLSCKSEEKGTPPHSSKLFARI